MYQVVVVANLQHAHSEGRIHSACDLLSWNRLGWFLPYSVIAPAACILGVVRAVARRNRADVRAWLLPAATCILAYAGIVMQLKAFPYYFGLMVAPFTLVAATAADWLLASVERRRLAVTVLGVGLVVIPVTMVPHDVWLDHASTAIAWGRGMLTTTEVRRTFVVGGDGVDIGAGDQAAAWIRMNTSPQDALLVRGYEPQLYARSRRHWTGRFFWSGHLMVVPGRERDEYLAQDTADFEREPPETVVALNDAPRDSRDSPAWFVRRGYVERERFGPFVILTRGPRRT
jgi:hypothetical protein